MSFFGMSPGSFGMTQMKEELLFRALASWRHERAALATRKNSDVAKRARFLRMFRIRRILFRLAPRFAEWRWAL